MKLLDTSSQHVHWWHKRAAEKYVALLFIAPAVVLIGVFKLLPLGSGVEQSFKVSPGLITPRWAGLTNYDRMWHDPLWHQALRNSAKGLVVLPIYVIAPLVIAFLLAQRVPGWKVFRATYFVSFLLPPVMVGYMFGTILGQDGPLNALLRTVGLGAFAQPWLGQLSSSMWAVYAVVFWAWFGLGVVIYTAGLATVPHESFDAAKVDGANFLQTLRFVVVPAMLPTMAYWGTICATGMLLWLFPFIYSLTAGGPAGSSATPEFYIYQIFSQGDQGGYASALGITLFGITAVLVTLVMRLTYRKGRSSS